jgi:hypothetical protein
VPEMHPRDPGSSPVRGRAQRNAQHFALWPTLAMTGAASPEALALRWRGVGLDADSGLVLGQGAGHAGGLGCTPRTGLVSLLAGTIGTPAACLYAAR